MISIYAPTETDFSSIGICVLLPTECAITEKAGGEFSLTMKHPIDDEMRWTYLVNGYIIKAPAPIRETPAINLDEQDQPPTTTTVITRQIYRVVTQGGRLHLRTGPSTSYKIIGKYQPGTKVVKLKTSGNWMKVSIVKGGATGWMHTDYLRFVENQTQTITTEAPDPVPTYSLVESVQTREQLFRIMSHERDTENQIVTVKAQHIFYDLQGNIITNDYKPNNVSIQTAVSTFLSYLSQTDHPFSVHCLATGNVTGDYSGMSLVRALLDPDVGVVNQVGARLIRDNYDIWILNDETRDRGMEIRHGKNLVGAILNVDQSSIVTRIRPVGQNKNGNRLFLTGTGFVDSSHINDYPVIYAQEISYDVKVGSGTGEYASDAAARAKLTELANTDFANGIDLPVATMSVDFIALENTEEYADYAALLTVFLYDTVGVIATFAGINSKLRVSEYEYDCLSMGYSGITLGALESMSADTYGYQIASGSLSGSRLLQGSVTSEQIRDMTIRYAKIAAAAIEQLSADSIVALTAHFNELTAQTVSADTVLASVVDAVLLRAQNISAQSATLDHLTAATAEIIAATVRKLDAGTITTDALKAAVADIVALNVGSITAQTISTDRLAVALANFVSLDAGTASFSLATITNLLANALVLETGYAGKMKIKNLVVTDANLSNAIVDKLCVLGDDGKYYVIGVGSDGGIKTREYVPSAAEIAAGVTTDGRGIVVTTQDVAGLDGSDIKDEDATMAAILAASIAANKITAQEALIASASIPTLYTTAINALENVLQITAKGVSINAADTVVAMNGSGVRIVAKQTEIAVPGDDGESDKLRVDEEGVNADVITANDIRSDSVQNAVTGGSATAASAGELAALLENLRGRYLRGALTVYCSAVTSGAFDVSGIEGAALTLTGGTFNRFSATNCDAPVVLDGVTFAASDTAITCNRARITADGCTINAANSDEDAVGVACTAGVVVLDGCDGGCDVLADARIGGAIYITGDTIPYGLAQTHGGDIYTNSIPTARPAPPSPEPETVELALNATTTWNWGSSGSGTEPMIGRYNTGNLNRGAILFDLSGLRSYVADGYTVTSATLTIKRYSGIGGGGYATCQIYGTTTTTSGSQPTIGAMYATVDMPNGGQRTVDVTTLASALGAGTYHGVLLYNPSTDKYSSKTYTYTFSRYYGASTAYQPVLRITLEKAQA